MKYIFAILVVLLGIGIGAISYWRIPYEELNVLELNLWLIVGGGSLIGALCSTLLFKLKPLKIGLLLTLGVVLSVIFRIIYDLTVKDPSSHNLAPLEIIFSVLQSLPFAFAGSYIAGTLQKQRNQQ